MIIFNLKNLNHLYFSIKFLASRAHAKGVIYFDDKSAVWIGIY
jgi:hypothetical protein